MIAQGLTGITEALLRALGSLVDLFAATAKFFTDPCNLPQYPGRDRRKLVGIFAERHAYALGALVRSARGFGHLAGLQAECLATAAHTLHDLTSGRFQLTCIFA